MLSEITLESLEVYHKRHFGSNELVLVVVGDIDPKEIVQAVEASLASWRPHAAPAVYEVAAQFNSPIVAKVPMEEKSSIDVRLGHALELRMNHEGYIPFYLGNFMLGGIFLLD